MSRTETEPDEGEAGGLVSGHMLGLREGVSLFSMFYSIQNKTNKNKDEYKVELM